MSLHGTVSPKFFFDFFFSKKRGTYVSEKWVDIDLFIRDSKMERNPNVFEPFHFGKIIIQKISPFLTLIINYRCSN